MEAVHRATPPTRVVTALIPSFVVYLLLHAWISGDLASGMAHWEWWVAVGCVLAFQVPFALVTITGRIPRWAVWVLTLIAVHGGVRQADLGRRLSEIYSLRRTPRG
jgi:hypothetical protein